MSLPEIVKKEINIIRSRKIALAMILVYPVLIILILVAAFGDSGATSVNMAVYVPESVAFEEFSADQMLTEISGAGNVNIIRLNSPDDVVNAIQRGEALVGFVIYDQTTAEGQLLSDLILDNSSLTSSKVMPAYAKSAVQVLGVEITSHVVQSLWSNLTDVKNNLQIEIAKVDEFLTDVQATGQRLEELDQSVSNIDLGGLSSQLSSQKSSIAGVDSEMQQFESDFAAFQSDITNAKGEVADAKQKLAAYENEIDDRIEEVKDTREELEDYRETLIEVRAALTGPPDLVAELDQTISKLNNSINRLQSAEAELQQAKTDIQTMKAKLNAIDSDLDTASQRLSSGAQSMEGLSSKLGSTSSDIDSVVTTLSGLSETLDEVQSLVDDGLESKDLVESRLLESKVLLSEFIVNLDKLTGYSPEFLAKPLWIYEKNLFEDITLLGLVAPIAISLILLLTCLLLTTTSVILERTQGVALRLKVSATNTLTLLGGKVLGQMIFAMFVSLVILAYAFINIELPVSLLGYNLIGFGIPFTPLKLVESIAAVAIIAFSFICLGLFITNFIKRESSAVLASLLIIIPMFFISGIIVPLAFMPFAVQVFSSVMPLTAANSLLTEIMLRNNSLLFAWPQIAVLLVPAILMFGFTLFKEQKKD